MKTLSYFSLGFLIAAVCLSCRDKSYRSDPRFYVDYQYHFKLPLPSGWTATDSTGLPDVLVAVCSPDTVSGFIPNLTITLERLDRVCTAREYAARNLQKLQANRFLPMRQSEFCSARIRFWLIESGSSSPDLPLRLFNYFMVKDRLGFVFTGVAPEEGAKRYRTIFQQMVAGFEFLQ